MRKRTKYVVRLILLAVTLGFAFWLGSVASESQMVQELVQSGGYLGVLLFAFVNGFNVLIPVVTASFIPALTEAGLDPYVLVAVMTLGMTLADTTVFLLARAGRMRLPEKENGITRTVRTAERLRHWLPLTLVGLWAAVVPLPNELILIPLGFMGYHVRHVLPVVFIGNSVFTTLVGLGFVNLFSILGT